VKVQCTKCGKELNDRVFTHLNLDESNNFMNEQFLCYECNIKKDSWELNEKSKCLRW